MLSLRRVGLGVDRGVRLVVGTSTATNVGPTKHMTMTMTMTMSSGVGIGGRFGRTVVAVPTIGFRRPNSTAAAAVNVGSTENKAKPLVSSTNVADMLLTQEQHVENRRAAVPTTNKARLEDYEELLSTPHEWYHEARALGRKVHLHVGPTNSGKTHTALERLKVGGLGVYCGPLRMLAWQVAESLEKQGYPCSLMTGQERQVVEGAALQACTVEMADPNQFVHVAVVDEIQMIADKHRGWAWTQAVLGMRALELHLCGDDSVVDLIKRVCEITGEELTIHEYERLTPLLPSTPVNDLKNVRGGDCVVAFSRKDIYVIKNYIEQHANLRCAVVYGGLPPENRKHQARMFNESNGEMVMVASDAVGMGLNLSIRRVIFATDEKFDGSDVRALQVTEIKQIGGRAGRHGHGSEKGEVTVVKKEHLPMVEKALSASLPRPQFSFVSPRYEVLRDQVEALAAKPQMLKKVKVMLNKEKKSQFPEFDSVASKTMVKYLAINEALSNCLVHHTNPNLNKLLQKKGMPFVFAPMESQLEILKMLRGVPVPFEILYRLCQAPVGKRTERANDVFVWYARQLGMFELGLLPEGTTPQVPVFHINNKIPATMSELQEMEDLYQALDVSMWVGLAFGHPSKDLDAVAKERRKCTVRIQQGLDLLHEEIASSRAKQKEKRSALREKKAKAAVKAAAATAPVGASKENGGMLAARKKPAGRSKKRRAPAAKAPAAKAP